MDTCEREPVLYREENLCVSYLTKDEGVVMIWTTEHLARKVRSGEKKKHKGRRAVEIIVGLPNCLMYFD